MAGENREIAQASEADENGTSAIFDDGFSEQGSDDEEQAMSLAASKNLTRNIDQRQYTKLEVVQARQVEKLLLWQYLFIGIGILFTLVVVVCTRFVWSMLFSPPDWKGRLVLTIFDAPVAVLWFNHIAAFVTFTYSFLLCATFCFRIMGLRKQDRTHEQIWVLALLIYLSIYLIPWTSAVKIHDLLLNPEFLEEKMWGSEPWFNLTNKVFLALRQTTFTASTAFYVWASVHSYRILESDIDIMFYLPKLVALGVYVAVKVMVWFEYRIQSAEMMFTSFFGMISTYETANKWLTPGVVFGTFSMLFELALGAYILGDMWHTKEVLKNADYLKYRTKQIGFRFFLYHNLVFYFVFWALYMTLLLGIPQGLKGFAVVIMNESNFEVHDFMFGIQVLLLAYATVEAYVNLPADALGLAGWFRPQLPTGGADSTELEPITYRKREPPSLKGVVSDLNVNCFIMQTHVTMFNFAWLVYYWDTPKVEDFKLTQDVFKFSVAQFIKDKPTDTQVLVVDGTDRIVIAFKGTTSTKNLRTDVNMFYSSASTLLPTRIGEGDEEGDREALSNPLLKSRNWRWAKIHKGFATAYAAVGPMLLSTVKRLQEERRRPVFLTGHSLGGALCGICSLDLHLRLGLTRREIFVSTFGAPRVGNGYYANIYNEFVPIHWRIVVGPDVVAKLPKIGFTHVGKKVLITVDGDLFIDPNSLELNFWSGDVASILYHRKASYLLAMRAWCERHHGNEYLPEFWPFPVSKDDTRRFQHAMVRSIGSEGPASHGLAPKKKTSAASKRSRMRQMDAMIDALEGPEGKPVSDKVLQSWELLARGLIRQHDEAATQFT